MTGPDESIRADRQVRRAQTQAMAAQAFLEAMVRLDQAGLKVMALSRQIAARSRSAAAFASAEHDLGFRINDPLQLAVVHAWEDFLSAFYAVLNRYAAVFALIAADVSKDLRGVRMKVWLSRLSNLFPEVGDKVAILESARLHRSKWIDHPQVAGASLDWMTTQARTHGISITVPVRLKVRPGPLKLIWNGGMANPWQFEYLPPVDCEGWGAPPCPICLARALMSVVRVTSAKFGYSWDAVRDPTMTNGVHDCEIPPDPPPVADSKLGRWTCDECGQRWQLWRYRSSAGELGEPIWREVDVWPEPATNPS
jgi:hypothetical protein